MKKKNLALASALLMLLTSASTAEGRRRARAKKPKPRKVLIMSAIAAWSEGDVAKNARWTYIISLKGGSIDGFKPGDRVTLGPFRTTISKVYRLSMRCKVRTTWTQLSKVLVTNRRASVTPPRKKRSKRSRR